MLELFSSTLRPSTLNPHTSNIPWSCNKSSMHVSRTSALVVGTAIPMELKECGSIWWQLVTALPFLCLMGEPVKILLELSEEPWEHWTNFPPSFETRGGWEVCQQGTDTLQKATKMTIYWGSAYSGACHIQCCGCGKFCDYPLWEPPICTLLQHWKAKLSVLAACKRLWA